MAKIEKIVNEDFDQLLKKIEIGILGGNSSASIEDASDFCDGDAKCSIRVFERFSFVGKNRVSLNVTLFQKADGPVHLSTITSGGSQGMFLKINTWGEKAFLDKLTDLL